MKKILTYPEIRAVRFTAQDIVTASGFNGTNEKPGFSDSGYEGGYAPCRNVWGDGEGTTRLF